MIWESYHRHLSFARARADSPTVRVEIGLEARLQPGSTEVAFIKPQLPAAAHVAQVTEVYHSLATRLPAALRQDLSVEAGTARVAVDNLSRPRCAWEQSYLVVIAGGRVWNLGADPVADPREMVEGEIDWKEIDPALPVVLGPSAVLGLLCHLLDTAQGKGNRISFPGSQLFQVISTTSSPYPPHHLLVPGGAASFDLSPRFQSDYRHTASGLAEPAPDLLFLLCTDKKDWMRPFDTVYDTRYLNLEVNHKNTVCPDDYSPALSIDSLSPLDKLNAGAIDWLAKFSVQRTTEKATCGASYICLNADPTLLLGCVRGIVGQIAMGLDHDPIVGNRFGLAPSLATGLAAGNLSIQ